MSMFSSSKVRADGVPMQAIQLIPYTSVFYKERTCGGPAATIACAQRLSKQAKIAHFPTDSAPPTSSTLDEDDLHMKYSSVSIGKIARFGL
jgi:hypothetical protein